MPVIVYDGYNKRTGVTSLKKFVKALCKVYQKFKPSIDGWIDANIEEPRRTTVKASLNDIVVACNIIEVIPDD